MKGRRGATRIQIHICAVTRCVSSWSPVVDSSVTVADGCPLLRMEILHGLKIKKKTVPSHSQPVDEGHDHFFEVYNLRLELAPRRVERVFRCGLIVLCVVLRRHR